jgi:hypothetical protein
MNTDPTYGKVHWSFNSVALPRIIRQQYLTIHVPYNKDVNKNERGMKRTKLCYHSCMITDSNGAIPLG